MAVTLLESTKSSKDYLRTGVIKTIVEVSPILNWIKMKTIRGSAYRYLIEAALPNVAFRAVNQTWTRSAGIINPQAEMLSIMGGEIFVDNFQINTQGNVVDIKAKQYDMFARAMAIQFSSSFFNGDSNTDPNSFDGLRRRITGTQLVLCQQTASGVTNTNGLALTIPDLDYALDMVVGDGEGKHIFMNKTLRRKVTALARAQTGTVRIEESHDDFNRQYLAYAGVPIHVIERSDDQSTFLDFTETQGSGSCASIYVARFGNEDFVFGIQGEGGDLQVKDFGEEQAEPGHLGRAEWYVGMVVTHPRSASRIYGILNA